MGTQLTPLPQAPAPQHNAHPYSDQDYSRGKRQWPNPFVIYTARAGRAAECDQFARASIRLLKDGKMYLSINDAVALALENNLDIGIQRYNLSIADTDILRTSSGRRSAGRQRRPVARHARRHNRHDRGRRHGNLDYRINRRRRRRYHDRRRRSRRRRGGHRLLHPGRRPAARQLRSCHHRHRVDLDARLRRSRTPSFTGTNELNKNTTTANFIYTQGFPTGTLMTVGFDNTRVASNALFNTLNPTLTPSFHFQLRQHLLQGFGFDPNLRYIRIARNNKMITEVTFRNQIITTVSQIENIYWDLVNAYENVTVQQRALDLANKTLSDNQKQVTAGTLAPLTVVQSQSAVATAKQNLIAAQVNFSWNSC